MIDYKHLLEEYMAFVAYTEGADFVADAIDYGKFTDEEKVELERMSKAIKYD